MSTAPSLSVCADIGGTFTDCLAVQTDATGTTRSGCVKILSSGRIRCKVIDRTVIDRTVIDSDDRFEIQILIPQELLGSTQQSLLPEDFFRGARLEWVSEGIGLYVGIVQAFAARTSTLSLQVADSDLAEQVACDGIVELDCGLEAPVLATHLLLGIPVNQPLPALTARIGTTRGTNALLTRGGALTALVVTNGFADVLKIGEQTRSDLFDLAFTKTPPLAETVLSISARLDADGKELVPIDHAAVESGLQSLFDAGVKTLAIALLHAYQNPAHEIVVEQLARAVGFQDISRSSEVAPLIKLVARAETTTLDAYLNPILSAYVRRIRHQFGGERCRLQWMSSGGNLVDSDQFRGRDSVLSGPAGGVVALQHVARAHDCKLAIGLDMGGTSTDVSRYDGQVGRRYESRIADLRVMTPMMDIHTVAAGGGSICDFASGRLVVGPTSAGAMPGPACYGRGGPLTITDLNLLLGRLRPDRFPFPLSANASRERLGHVAARLPVPPADLDSLAEGFLEIAVTHMAEAVRAITTARGVDVRDHALIGFGGAAAQHICRVADALGVGKIIDHPRASVLSAVGMGVATTGRIETVGIYRLLHQLAPVDLSRAAEHLIDQTHASFHAEQDGDLITRLECDCRYVGTDAPIALPLDTWHNQSHLELSIAALVDQFHDQHRNRFGYQRLDQPVELVSLRCEVISSDTHQSKQWLTASDAVETLHADLQRSQSNSVRPVATETANVFHGGQWQTFKLIERHQLTSGSSIDPASIVVSDQSTLIVEPNWRGIVAPDGTIVLTCDTDRSDAEMSIESIVAESRTNQLHADDSQTSHAVQMEIVARRLQSIADAMGEVLRRTAVSVNVKERLDFSCAIFDGQGTLIANAHHVPVHLGAMGHTVRDLAGKFPEMSAGDCYVSNDPYAGGSHLPDITVVTPVFCEQDSSIQDGCIQRPSFYVASRAHHAEIGGKTPGSMPPLANSLAEEGVLIRGFALVRQGVSHESELGQLLASGQYPSRNVAENLADIRAQIAAGQEGAVALRRMAAELSLAHVQQMMNLLLDVAADAVQRWIMRLPETPMRFSDSLDDGTKIAVLLQRQHDRLVIDFSGTSGVHPNGYNAAASIVTSAVLYVTRCFGDSNLPLCDGAMRPIELRVPVGLLAPPCDPDPSKCAAVVAGNVETSQRIVDVLLGAIGATEDGDPKFRAIAASQGTMNNLLIGDDSFGYYETIGGGSGATILGPGADGVHTHMTNTRITDPEVLESRLPVRLHQFSLRPGSGGIGKHRGGEGLIREFEFLRPLTVSLITSRRTTQPYGVMGGGPGAAGRNQLTRVGEQPVDLPPATTIEVVAGDRLRIETPGGGGWGKLPESTESTSTKL